MHSRDSGHCFVCFGDGGSRLACGKFWSGSSDVVALRAWHGDGDGLWSVATALIAYLRCDVPAICRWCDRLAGLRSCGKCVSHRKGSSLRDVARLAYIDVCSCVRRSDGVRRLGLVRTVCGHGCRGGVDRSRGIELRKIRVVVLLDGADWV